MIKKEYVRKMTKEEYEREKEKAMKGGLSYRMNCCGKSYSLQTQHAGGKRRSA